MKTTTMFLTMLAALTTTVYGQNKPAVTKTAAQSSPKPKLAACPIKLGTESNMTLDGFMYINLDITNTTETDITGIRFSGLSHADALGDVWEPYKRALYSDETIAAGETSSLSWSILMEEPTGRHAKPGTSTVKLIKVAFEDGRILTSFAGCSFTFNYGATVSKK